MESGTGPLLPTYSGAGEQAPYLPGSSPYQSLYARQPNAPPYPPPPPPAPAPAPAPTPAPGEHPAHGQWERWPGNMFAQPTAPAEVRQIHFHAAHTHAPLEGQHYLPYGLPDSRAHHSYGPPEGPGHGIHLQSDLHTATHQELIPGRLAPSRANAPPPWPPHTLGDVGGYHSPGAGLRGQIRRQVRASRACDTCRQQKSKCDEERPKCSRCTDNDFPCTYREAPLSKQQEQIRATCEKLDSTCDTIRQRSELMLDRQESQRKQIEVLLSAIGAEERISSATRSASLPTFHDQHLSRSDSALHGPRVLPPQHATATQDIVSWPAIRNLLKGGVADTREHRRSYVVDLELDRGLLRLYGCGEGKDQQDDGDGAASLGDPSSGGVGGDGMLLAYGPDAGSLDRDGAGEASLRGGLLLDATVLDRCYQSYMEKMHILHPFLNSRLLALMLDSFKNRYCGHYTVPLRGPTSWKRRHVTEDATTTHHRAPFDDGRHPIDVERSIGNAIVLFVIALGNICAHEEPLPGPVPSSSGTRTDRMAPTVHGPTDASRRNTDVIPGLAYFARGAEILGELPGGSDVSHVQANLLAGLYMGQLARIIPNHYYISNACNACQVLIESTDYRTRRMRPERRNLINLAFWSCLQLESEILAEVNLPPSGIARHQVRQSNELPTATALEASDHEAINATIMQFYLNQVQLCRTLDEVHRRLYQGRSCLDRPSPSLTSALADNLEKWRHLQRSLGWDWDDRDHPSTDVNVARLRAQYYGAKYLIHRPALSYALSVLTSDTPLPPRPPPSSGRPGYGTPLSLPVAPDATRGEDSVGPTATSAVDQLEPWIRDAAKTCVEAAICRTTAFDAVPGRLIVTNIFGTAHAQFSDMLVLAAVWNSDLHYLLDANILVHLFERTIRFLQFSENISPALRYDTEVLQHIRAQLFPP